MKSEISHVKLASAKPGMPEYQYGGTTERTSFKKKMSKTQNALHTVFRNF